MSLKIRLARGGAKNAHFIALLLPIAAPRAMVALSRNLS